MSVETWRLWKSWDESPVFNMGLDEALLEAPEAGSAPVTLRLYTWRPATLSLGYFQRSARIAEIERAEALGGAIVRRITGGGAIHHANELTFSITAQQSHPLYRGPVPGSYERVHELVIRTLQHFGVDAHLRGDAGLESDREGSAMCFHVSTPLDIAWNNRKGVGSAQRRRDARVLHHGSIKLGTTELEGDIATVQSSANVKSIDAETFGDALVEVFAEALGIRFESSEPDASMREQALARGARYASPEFVRRK